MSGDMMMDGVPGVRAAEGAAAQSFREVHLRGRVPAGPARVFKTRNLYPNSATTPAN
jgi:hypothetical protein